MYIQICNKYTHVTYIYIHIHIILYLDQVDQPISSNIVTVLLETAWHRLVLCVFLQATSIRMHMRLTSNSIAWMRAHLKDSRTCIYIWLYSMYGKIYGIIYMKNIDEYSIMWLMRLRILFILDYSCHILTITSYIYMYIYIGIFLYSMMRYVNMMGQLHETPLSSRGSSSTNERQAWTW